MAAVMGGPSNMLDKVHGAQKIHKFNVLGISLFVNMNIKIHLIVYNVQTGEKVVNSLATVGIKGC